MYLENVKTFHSVSMKKFCMQYQNQCLEIKASELNKKNV